MDQQLGPILLVILLAAAGVWALVAMRFARPFGMGLATVLAGVCAGPNLLRLSALSVDRAMLVLALISTTLAGARGQLSPWRWQKPDLLLGAWISWLALSTLTHDWSLRDGLPVSTLVFYYLLPAAIYFVARRADWDEHRWRVFWITFTLLGTYLGLTAWAEMQRMTWAVFPSYIASSEFSEFLGRGRGPLLNPVGNGIYLSTGLACCLVAATSGGRWRRMVLSLCGAVMLAGCYATLTRSVWMGAAATLFVIGTLIVPRGRRPAVVCLSVVLALAVVATQWERFSRFKRDENVSAAEMEQSASLRPILATIAWKMFQDRPWAGVGLGQYLNHNRDYTADRTFGLPLEKGQHYIQHNTALSLLTETGVIGLALYVVVLGSWVIAAWRRWSKPGESAESRWLALVSLGIFAAYGVNSMFHELSVIPMVNMLLFFLAGLTVRAQAHHSASGVE